MSYKVPAIKPSKMEFDNVKEALEFAKFTQRKVIRSFRDKVNDRTGEVYRKYYYIVESG